MKLLERLANVFIIPKNEYEELKKDKDKYITYLEKQGRDMEIFITMLFTIIMILLMLR